MRWGIAACISAWMALHAQSDHHLEHKATTRAPSMRMFDIDFMHTLLPILWNILNSMQKSQIFIVISGLKRGAMYAMDHHFCRLCICCASLASA